MYKSTFNWTDWNIRNVTKLFHKCSWNWHRLQEQKLGAETTTDVFKPAQNSSGFVHSNFRIDLSSAPTPGLHSYRKNNFTRPIKPGEQNKVCHTNYILYIKWNVTTWRFLDQSFCLIWGQNDCLTFELSMLRHWGPYIQIIVSSNQYYGKLALGRN